MWKNKARTCVLGLRSQALFFILDQGTSDQRCSMCNLMFDQDFFFARHTFKFF